MVPRSTMDKPAMSTFSVVYAKEWTEVRRDGRIRFTSLAVVLLLIVAVTGSWLEWSWYDQESRIGTDNAHRQFTEQKEKHPHSAAHLGIYAWKPAAPLSMLDPGVNPHTGMTIWLEPHIISPAKLKPEQSLTALEKSTRFSPAEVLRFFMPLLIILIGAALFAGERETGTLRQTLSIGISRWRLLQGKALVAAAAPLFLLAVFMAVGVFGVASTAPPFDRSDTAARLVLQTIGFLLYAVTWVALSLGVSALSRTVRVALFALVSLWALQTWVIPQAAGNLARLNSPVLTPSEFVSKAAATKVERSAEMHLLLSEAKAKLLEENGVTELTELPFNPEGLLSKIQESFLSGIFDEEIANQRTAFEHQRQDLLLASVLAPSIALRDWSMAAAGTNYIHHLHFTDAAEAYRRRLVDYSYDALRETQHGAAYKSILVDRDWFEARPRFEYRPVSFRDGVYPAIESLFVLAVWAGGAVRFAGWAVRRLRP